MASENDRHEAYKNYIAANESTVLKGLENWLLFGRPIAEASILYEIRKCLDPWPAHFILENSQSRKARDGVLLENGYICKNLTIKDFLNEFSGKVFLCEGENGYDEYYTTYGESILCGDMTFVADSVMSSEGEKIALNMQKLSMKIGSLMKKYPDEKEFWIFLDGVDSGFSVDAIENLKRGLFDTIFDCYPDKDIYIIASANEYEMARGEKCFDTVNCRYVNIL